MPTPLALVCRLSLGAATVAALWGTGCSLTTVARDQEACDDNADCRTAFGLGSTCNTDGFCTPPQIDSRCSRTFPEDLFQNQDLYLDRVLVGSVFDYEVHNDTLQAAELAVRQVNENSGLDGRRYAMVHCNYGVETDEIGNDDIAAVERVAPFLARVLDVPAIVGPRGSARTEAAFNAIRDDQVVLISPSATSPALTALDNTSPTDELPGFLWRTAPPDSLQSEVISEDMITRGVERVAIIFQSGAYGDGLTSLFVSRFTTDGTRTAEEFPFDNPDFASTIATVGDRIRVGDFQEVLFISSDIADYVTFFTAATATADLEEQYTMTLGMDLTEGGIFVADAAFSTDLLEMTAGSTASLYPKIRGTRPAPAAGAVFNSFAGSYTAFYNEDSTGSAFTPHSYDAGWLVIYGTAWSQFNEGRISGLGVARGLRKVSGGPALDIVPSSWTSVVDNFRNARSVDVQGASGSLNYDPGTEETSASIEKWRIVMDASAPSGYAFERVDLVEPS